MARKSTGRMEGKPLMLRLSPVERAEFQAAAARANLTESAAAREAMEAWIAWQRGERAGDSKSVAHADGPRVVYDPVD